MARFKTVLGAGALLLALGATSAHAGPEVSPVHVDFMGSCHTGLIRWKQVSPKDPKCGYLQVPQVKVFDGDGRLRYIGSVLEAIQWAKAGQPATPIPEGVVVRDTATEARITHVSAPPKGQGWVTFYGWHDCPPCQVHLGMFRTDVLPKLAPGTSLTVFDPT